MAANETYGLQWSVKPAKRDLDQVSMYIPVVWLEGDPSEVLFTGKARFSFINAREEARRACYKLRLERSILLRRLTE